MQYQGLVALCAIAMVAVMIAVPVMFGKHGAKWGAIGCSTIVTPVLMVGAISLTAKVYWHFNRDLVGSSCSGGECGAASYSGGLWPLLIPAFMIPAFFVSWIVIALMRSAAK